MKTCRVLWLLLASIIPLQMGCAQPANVPAEKPRNVILFIADGMGVSSVATTSTIFEREGKRLVLEQMPVTGLLRTNAAGHVVTESAASGTSLATGFKTTRRMVGMGPDSTRLLTIVEAARDQGFATGVITTTKLVDATPASFSSHAPSRYMSEDIATQMIASGIDVLMGGDGGVFTPDLVAAADEAGYEVIREDSALGEVAGDRLLGIFPERVPDTDAYGPPLAAMTARALSLFEGKDQPFLLVVEQEETDTGAHEHDLPRVLAGMEELNAAIQEALDVAGRDDDTLVLLTADHDTAGFSETEDENQVRWLTGGHTNQWVPIFASGPGALTFTGVHENTEVPRLIARLLDLNHFLEAFETESR